MEFLLEIFAPFYQPQFTKTQFAKNKRSLFKSEINNPQFVDIDNRFGNFIIQLKRMKMNFISTLC